MRRGLKKGLALLISVSMAMSSMQTTMTVNAMENSETFKMSEEESSVGKEENESQTEEESEVNVEENFESEEESEIEVTESDNTTQQEETKTEETMLEEAEEDLKTVETDTEKWSETEKTTLEEPKIKETTEEAITELETGEILEDNILIDNGGKLGGAIYYNNSTGYIVDADKDIVNIVIPEEINGCAIKGIADNAFKECKKLKSVVIPDTVTYFGKNIFYYCEALTDVTLPSNMTEISYGMFSGCDNLRKIELPASITEIGDRAFSGSGIENIDFPDGLKKIGNSAFSSSKIERLILPDSVEDVGEDAFSSLYYLSYAKLSSGMTTINERLFVWDYNLKEVEIPEGIECIGAVAFCENEKLEEIEFPESLVSIKCDAFAQATQNLKRVYFNGDAIDDLESGAFSGCDKDFTIYYKAGKSGWTTPYWKGYRTKLWCDEEDEEDEEDICEYSDEKGLINGKLYFDKKSGYIVSADKEIESAIIPEIIDGIEVAGIKENAFSDCKKLNSVVIPNTVTDIGHGAFYNCYVLSKITLPKDLKIINSYTFYNCYALKEIELPAGITEIGNSAFFDSGLMNITFPYGLEYIGEEAFFDNNLSELILPDSVETVGGRAFSYNNLETIKLSSRMTKISMEVFSDNELLKEIDIPDNIECIEDNAFAACRLLNRVTFSDNLKTIKSWAFGACDNLKEIEFPESLEYIGEGAFEACYSLSKAYFNGNAPELVKSGSGWICSGVFDYCSYDFSIYRIEGKEGWDASTWKKYKIKLWEGKNYKNEEIVKYHYKDDSGKLMGFIYFDKVSQYIVNVDKALEYVDIPQLIDGTEVKGIKQGAFKNCKKLKRVIIPETVTYIGEEAFRNCTDLEIIELPSKITKIENSTFYNCTNLELIKLPSDITEISYGAFCYCSKLKEVELPLNVTYIGRYAFFSSGIEKIVFNQKLKTIDAYAFVHTKIKELILPDSIEKVGEYAFGDISDLSTVKLSNSLTKICTGTFYMDKGLKSIDISENIEIIEDSAFSCCNLLEKVYFNKKIREIKSEAFYDCKKLFEIQLPESITVIDNDAFYNCFLTKIYFNGNAPQIVYNKQINDKNYAFVGCSEGLKLYYKDGKEGWTTPLWNGCKTIVWNDSNINKYECRDISGALIGCIYFDEDTGYIVSADKDSEYVEIPKSINGIEVIGIEESAFAFCEKLKSIIIPDTVTEIRDKAFYGCCNLSSISLPLKINKINSEAFYGCTNLKSIELPSGITEIENSAFAFCEKLESIIIPDTVTEIRDRAFYECCNLSSISLPLNINKINSEAFYGCKNLKLIELPSGITKIENSAFRYSGIEDIVLPESLEIIGWNAFAFSSLEEVEFPENLQTINYNAFFGCKCLKEVVFNEKLKVISDSSFEGCNSLKKVVFNENLIEIGRRAFLDCDSLEKLTFSKNLRLIDTEAFANCDSLEMVIFDENLQRIDLAAFSDCPFLCMAYFKGNAPIMRYGAFSACADNFKIYFEDGKEGWSIPKWNGYETDKWSEQTDEQKSYEVEGGNIYISTISNAIIGCDPGVTKAVIPEVIEGIDVKGIKPNAFGNNKCIEYIEIPKSVDNIAEYAFYYCDRLNTIVNNSEAESRVPINSEWFDESFNYYGRIFIKGTFRRCITIDEVKFSKTEIYTTIGKTVDITATYLPDTDAVRKRWYNSNENVAFIENGRVYAVGEGEAIITLYVNSKKAECKIIVYKNPILVDSITLNRKDAHIDKGENLQLLIESYGPYNVTDEPVFTWTSSDTSVATVDGTGKVTALNEGKVTIFAESGNAKACCDIVVGQENESEIESEPESEIKSEPESEIESEPEKDMDYGFLSVKTIKSQMYTGSAIKPEIVITNGKTRLVQGTDYIVSYKNNINAGKATAVIRYKGSYSGEEILYFDIIKADLNEVIAENIGLSYNGKSQKKAPALSYNGKTLKKDKDYTVEFENKDFKEVGVYKVTYTGIGNNFTGTTQGTVTITQKAKPMSKASIKLEKNTWTYTGVAIEPKVTVKMSGKLVGSENYDVRYNNNTEAGKAYVIIEGKGEYAGTKKIKFTIKKQPVELNDSMVTVEASVPILKGGCRPEPVVKCDGTVLNRNIDYTVSYNKNKVLGIATVTVKGKGNYRGTVKKNFTITQKDISLVHMRAADIIYTGKAGKYVSKPVLIDSDGVALTSADYCNITYSVNGSILGKKDKCEPKAIVTVTVTGKGKYTGTASTTYNLLTGNVFSKSKITVNAKPYTGKEVEIGKDDIKVMYKGTELIYKKDYDIIKDSYKNNIKKGKAKVTIKGCGEYVGEKTVTFTIKPMGAK